jgi:hypothetical protein
MADVPYFAEAVYLLCAATSFACMIMLFRGYSRSRMRFLLWSSLCFLGLAINNILLFIDKAVFPEQTLLFLGLEMAVWRSVAALIGLSLLLYGLIWDTQ